jgi:hypothetical protein
MRAAARSRGRCSWAGGSEGNEDIRTGDCNSDDSDVDDDSTCTRSQKDLVKGAPSGIIRLNKSTVGDVKGWFGPLDLRAP